jgi:hypothetical protein
MVIRYYEARPPGWEAVPICAEGKMTASLPLEKLPQSQPGMSLLYTNAVVVAVDRFR